LTPAKNNLIALGSAAVIAVYATGYARTRAAAAEFADEGRERPPVHPAKQDAVAPVAATRAPTAPVVAALPAPEKAKASASESPKSSSPKKAVTSETKPDTAAKTIPTAPVPPVATTTPPPAVAATLSPPATTPPKDTAVKSAVDTAGQSDKAAGYKDGMFTGWGTSRHGDNQATVMIKEGKIVGAVISECLTQYSCSWISMLPQQVIDRQSVEVDFVSGATQSTNAFYFAVLNALNKAK
jgi:uncharacterized protein with FMN-binding domain